MLVLSRRREQSVMVGDEIEIKVVRLQSGQVRLGISAPDWVPILRGELLDKREADEVCRRKSARMTCVES